MITKPLTPAARLKLLRAKLRYQQTTNRVSARMLRMGLARARYLGQLMREAQYSRRLTRRVKTE